MYDVLINYHDSHNIMDCPSMGVTIKSFNILFHLPFTTIYIYNMLNLYNHYTRALRVHTTCALCRISATALDIRCWRPLPTHERPVVCMSRRLMLVGMSWSVAMMPNKNTLFMMLVGLATWFEAQWGQFFCQIQQICYAYESLRYLDIEIWWFLVDNNDNDNIRQSRLLYPLCMCVKFSWVHLVASGWCMNQELESTK